MSVLLIGFLTWLIVQRLLELQLAQRNAEWARAKGAQEYAPEHYPLIVALHVAWIAAMTVESFARGPMLGWGWPVWLSVFVLAQLGRYWAISSLGQYWNTRILIVPGGLRVRRGPYRFLNHPNYVVVALEILSGPLIFGAWTTAIVFSLLNAALLLGIRIPAETRALEAYQRSEIIPSATTNARPSIQS
jgi:methyltransferase